MTRRFCTMLVVIMVGLMLASTVSAQRRVARRGAGEKKIALTFNLGGGIPNGSFSDTLPFGNHDPGTAYSIEGEYYFSRTASLGLAVQGGIFEDKEDSRITTNVTTVGAYVRYVAETKGKVRPFFRFGLTITQLELKDLPFQFERVDIKSESTGGFFTGVGFIAMVSPNLSVNGEVGYNFANTEDTEIKPNPWYYPNIVGFKTSYVTITDGISFYIPM